MDECGGCVKRGEILYDRITEDEGKPSEFRIWIAEGIRIIFLLYLEFII